MKKVLFLIHTLGGGGAEKVLVDLVNNLNPKKYDVTVMTVVDVGELRYELNDNIKYKTTIKLRRNRRKKVNKSGSLLSSQSNFKKLLIKIYSFFWRHANLKLIYSLFIREKYDIEIAFLEGISAKVISASNNKESKKYAWIHVDLIKQTKSEKVFKNRTQEIQTYNKFDKIICVSNVVREQFIKKYNFDKNRVIVKYNAINKNSILSKSKEKNEMVKEKGYTYIMSVGRLNAQKAYDRLFRVGKKLIDEGYKIKIYIIGEGTHGKDLNDYIIQNNLSNEIKLLGFKSNPYSYLKNADIFACSSITEGFSTVVSEAVILGIPVVTTDCAGMHEILGINNDYGIITENSEDALYDGLKEMLDDKSKYTYYKNKIKKRGKMFELKELVQKVEELLDE